MISFVPAVSYGLSFFAFVLGSLVVAGLWASLVSLTSRGSFAIF